MSEVIGEAVPADAYWAMDYHIDWLVGALELHANGEAICRKDGALLNDGLIKGTHQDVDLLIAYGDTVVLIEAKGATPWLSEQVTEKLARLRQLKSRAYPAVANIKVVLMSPVEPTRLKQKNGGAWPACMRKRDGTPGFMWMQLDMGGATPSFLGVMRCDADGISSKQGTHWRVQEMTSEPDAA